MTFLRGPVLFVFGVLAATGLAAQTRGPDLPPPAPTPSGGLSPYASLPPAPAQSSPLDKLTPVKEGLLDLCKNLVRPQIADLRPNLHRHMHRKSARQLRPGNARHDADGLGTSCSLALAAPAGQLQLNRLLQAAFHFST